VSQWIDSLIDEVTRADSIMCSIKVLVAPLMPELVKPPEEAEATKRELVPLASQLRDIVVELTHISDEYNDILNHNEL